MGEKMTLEQAFAALNYACEVICEYSPAGVRSPAAGKVMAAAATFRAHLLAREAEVERLQAIEKERWDVVATRNAAVMRAERAEALLREVAALIHPDTDEHKRITAHLSENSRG